MATIVLSSIGFAAGASVGGAVFGLSSAVIGRAIGATLGRVIDQRIMGAGSQTVETGKVDRFRLTGASEGAPVGQVYGAMRIGGQVIWASRFQETSTTSGGGKGAPSVPKTTSYSYTANLAIALCEGVITRVGRVWADGIEIARDDLNLRVYTGSEDQMPDPKIEAVEGGAMRRPIAALPMWCWRICRWGSLATGSRSLPLKCFVRRRMWPRGILHRLCRRWL